MNPPISTYVHGHDPISQAGVISQLRMRPEVRVVDDAAQASVALVVADAVDENTIRAVYHVTILVHSPASVGAISSPSRALSRVDLPALTLPAMASRRGP